ncbi:MAG: T9SS type A sorting domain-containing protein [Candidatus Cloacimonetes bacterium]|nr:T9SS type A sorting domain-containing protein [Candidatus Cloacimonadota bacterium]
MKKPVIIILLVFCCAVLMAQDINAFWNLRHSSRDNNGKIHLRWEGLNEYASLPYEAYYSTGNIWQAAAVTDYQSFTKEALIPYNFGQRLRYRLKTNMDYMGQAVSYMHAAYRDSDSFPIPLEQQALIAEDATGDSLLIYDPALDITDSYVASTSTKLYRSFGTVSGTFPTTINFTTYNLYASLIINPASVADTLAYAMVYCSNILSLISPGVYRVNMEGATPDFSRIGDVQTQVSGGKLYMSCDWATLTDDPHFGTWPNALNSLLFTDLTMRVSIDLATFTPELKPADTGAAGLVIFEDNLYQVSENNLPVLNLISCDLNTQETMIGYNDANSDFPLSVEVFRLDAGDNPIYTPLEPVYALDGSIRIENNTFDHGNFYRVSDNLIDYVVLETPMANDEEIQVPPARLSCRIYQNPQAGDKKLRMVFDGLSRSPLKLDIYNLKGQHVIGIPALSPQAGSWEYTLSRSDYPSMASGVYFLRFSQDAERGINRFVIVK